MLLHHPGWCPVSVNDDNSREAVALDPRVQIEGQKEKIAPVDAARERVDEANRRRNGGGQ